MRFGNPAFKLRVEKGFSLNKGGYRPGVYVSSVAANGIQIGNDTTGDGTPQKPYLTIDKGFTSTPAGQSLWLNGDPATPTDYRHATFLNITKAITIDAVRPWGASISSTTTAARAVNVAATSGAAVVFGAVIIDGRGLCPAAVSVGQQTTLMALTFNRTKLKDFTTSGLSMAVTSRISLSCLSADFSNTATDVSQGAISWLDASTGSSAVIKNCTGTINSQTGTTYGMIRIRGAVAGLPADVSDNNFTMVVKSGLAGSGVHHGILLENMIASADRNVLNLSGGSANHAIHGIVVTPSPAAPAYSITGSHANDNVVNHNGVSGIIVMLGQDVQGSAADGVSSTAEARRNACTGSATGQANGLHGILAGANITATVAANRISTTALALIDKVGSGCLFAANLCIDSTQASLRIKGAQNGRYRQNTFIEAAGYAGTFILGTNNDVPTVTNSAGCIVEGNIAYAPSLAAGGKFVSETASQDISYANNGYYAIGSATAPWTVDASNYANLAAWQGAHEASALGVDPAFVSPEYTPSAASLAAGIARSASVLTDVRGKAYADPATIGAFAA